ncbi:hypothetical protein BH09PLA1_BH09PLA1_01200 [soil metagenome]
MCADLNYETPKPRRSRMTPRAWMLLGAFFGIIFVVLQLVDVAPSPNNRRDHWIGNLITGLPALACFGLSRYWTARKM